MGGEGRSRKHATAQRRHGSSTTIFRQGERHVGDAMAVVGLSHTHGSCGSYRISVVTLNGSWGSAVGCSTESTHHRANECIRSLLLLPCKLQGSFSSNRECGSIDVFLGDMQNSELKRFTFCFLHSFTKLSKGPKRPHIRNSSLFYFLHMCFRQLLLMKAGFRASAECACLRRAAD